MSETLHTKWGNAHIDEKGYYRITSRKEGNRNKRLHNLIWEAYNGKLPENMVIHHIDGNKTNNRIDNLELLSSTEHATLHNKDRNDFSYLKGNAHNLKDYPRIIKKGFKKGKQNYAIMFNGKRIKQSIDKNKLVNWFEETYPNENIIFEVGDVQ